MGVLGTQDEVEKGSGKSKFWRVAEKNCVCFPQKADESEKHMVDWDSSTKLSGCLKELEGGKFKN